MGDEQGGLDEQARLREIRLRAEAVLARLEGCKGEVNGFVQAELDDARGTPREIVEITTGRVVARNVTARPGRPAWPTATSS